MIKAALRAAWRGPAGGWIVATMATVAVAGGLLAVVVILAGRPHTYRPPAGQVTVTYSDGTADTYAETAYRPPVYCHSTEEDEPPNDCDYVHGAWLPRR